MKKVTIKGYLKYSGISLPEGYTIVLTLYSKENIKIADDFIISGYKKKITINEIYNKAFKLLNTKVSGYNVQYLISDSEFNNEYFNENKKETYWEEISVDYEATNENKEIIILGDTELYSLNQMNDYIDKYIHLEITAEN